jgi:hypothetical protein
VPAAKSTAHHYASFHGENVARRGPRFDDA